MNRKALFASTALSLTLMIASPAKAQEIIDVPAQPLADALVELGTETGLHISAPSAVVDGKVSTAVSGSMTPQTALREMLADTGLKVRTPEANAAVLNFEDIVTQNTADEPFELGTLVLRGERISRTVAETASSVTVVDGERLENETGIRNTRETLRMLPSVFDEVGTNNAPTIRGVDSTGPATGSDAVFGGARPRTSVVVDGRALSSLELAFSEISVWDVEQIEAFNGPQTTTNGTNSIAGAIFLRYRNPEFSNEYAIRFYVGSDDLFGLSLMANQALSDQVAVRFALDGERQDSWREAVAALPFDRLDTMERLNGRLKVLYEPEGMPGLSNLFTLQYSRDQGPQTLRSDPPVENRQSTSDQEPAFSNEFLSGVYELNYDASNGWIISNTFQISESETQREQANTQGDIIRIKGDEIGNETLVNYEGDGIRGVFGLSWLRREEDVSAPFGPLQVSIEGENESFGIFGEAVIDLGDRFELTLGARWQTDDTTRTGDAIPGLGLATPLDFDESFSAFLPRVALAYDVSDTWRVGGLVSTGYNPGGVNAVFGIGYIPYDKETSITYELFTRASFMDDRVRLGANLFYTDIEDYQLRTDVPFMGVDFARIDNAESVRTMGLELTAEAQVTDNLFVDVALGLLDTEIREFSVSSLNVEANELPRAPDVTLSIGAQYEISESVSLGGRVRYIGSYFDTAENISTIGSGDFTVVDLTASWRPRENFEVFAFVNNVFDKDYVVQGGGAGPLDRVSFGDPREIGFGAEIRF